jgi:hypothetical protein
MNENETRVMMLINKGSSFLHSKILPLSPSFKDQIIFRGLHLVSYAGLDANSRVRKAINQTTKNAPPPQTPHIVHHSFRSGTCSGATFSPPFLFNRFGHQRRKPQTRAEFCLILRPLWHANPRIAAKFRSPFLEGERSNMRIGTIPLLCW